METCWSSMLRVSVACCRPIISLILKSTLISGCLLMNASSKGMRAFKPDRNVFRTLIIRVWRLNLSSAPLEESLTPVWTWWRLIGRHSNQIHGWCLCWWTSPPGGPSSRRLRAVWTTRLRLSSLLISQVQTLSILLFKKVERVDVNWHVAFQASTWRTLWVKIWATPASTCYRGKWTLSLWRRKRTTLCSLVSRQRYSYTLLLFRLNLICLRSNVWKYRGGWGEGGWNCSTGATRVVTELG